MTKETKETKKIKESEKSKKTKETIENKESEWLENILAVAIILIVIIGVYGFVQGWFTPKETVTNEDTVYNVEIGYNPSLGESKAPVTIVEFSNFGCSHCKDFALKTLPLIEENYISKGLVKFGYRDYTHPAVASMSLKASLAGACAYTQKNFWNYSKLMYENQEMIDDVHIREWAKEVGLNLKAFEDCLDNPNTLQGVANDYEVGANLGVSGTPTFFINGKKVIGAKSFEEFSKIIDEKLSEINSGNNTN